MGMSVQCRALHEGPVCAVSALCCLRGAAHPCCAVCCLSSAARPCFAARGQRGVFAQRHALPDGRVCAVPRAAQQHRCHQAPQWSHACWCKLRRKLWALDLRCMLTPRPTWWHPLGALMLQSSRPGLLPAPCLLRGYPCSCQQQPSGPRRAEAPPLLMSAATT